MNSKTMMMMKILQVLRHLNLQLKLMEPLHNLSNALPVIEEQYGHELRVLVILFAAPGSIVE